MAESLAFFDTAMLIFAAVALFVASFIIYNTFSILVVQRTPRDRAAALAGSPSAPDPRRRRVRGGAGRRGGLVDRPGRWCRRGRGPEGRAGGRWDRHPLVGHRVHVPHRDLVAGRGRGGHRRGGARAVVAGVGRRPDAGHPLGRGRRVEPLASTAGRRRAGDRGRRRRACCGRCWGTHRTPRSSPGSPWCRSSSGSPCSVRYWPRRSAASSGRRSPACAVFRASSRARTRFAIPSGRPPRQPP